MSAIVNAHDIAMFRVELEIIARRHGWVFDIDDAAQRAAIALFRARAAGRKTPTRWIAFCAAVDELRFRGRGGVRKYLGFRAHQLPLDPEPAIAGDVLIAFSRLSSSDREMLKDPSACAKHGRNQSKTSRLRRRLRELAA